MYLILNSDNEIKGVGVTTNPEYKSVYVDENADMFPFKGWSVARLCCYKVNVNENGIITMMTPYVDSRLIEHFDSLGISTEENNQSISETNVGLMETYETTIDNTNSIEDCNNALMELYELILGGE